MLKPFLKKTLIFPLLLIGYCSAQSKDPGILFTVYKMTEEVGGYGHEYDYKTTIIPLALERETKKKVITKKAEALEKECYKVDTKSARLYLGDRIILINLYFDFVAQKGVKKIYLVKVSKDDEDFTKPVQYFVDKTMKSSFIGSKYTGKYEILKDYVPYQKSKEEAYFNTLWETIRGAVFDLMNDSEQKETERQFRENKAVITGVRG